MVDYGLLPPEINSGRIYAGPGAGPMLAAAAAWSGLAGDFEVAAAGHRSVVAELTNGPWLGPASESLLSAVTPFIAWLDSSAAEAGQAAGQAFAAAAAFDTAFAASIPPPVIAANRALLAALVATNILGQNTPAIAATEALYLEFWAQDAAAMYNYAGSSAAATQLTELPQPAEATDPGALVDQAIAGFKGAGQAVQAQLNSVGAQLMPRVGDLLQTLSSPLNGQFTAIDQWLVANTPLDDLVPLYSKYISPYMSAFAQGLQDTLFVGDEVAGFSKLGSVANDLFTTAQAAEKAAQAAAAAAPKLSSSVGGVAAGLGRAVPLSSGLSVPVSWTSATAQAGSGVTAIGNATSISAAAEGAVGSSMPVAPPFGQFVNAGNGRRTPAYGHRLTFMTRPPAAG
ncbi:MULTISPECIES: PPE family protein [unclassified Mycobacterium]|uniref:PPE family protein n=1 Tax=unclassified Mycobacterium TaxID=2642494 RepID=UPI00274123EA|nr:MULTISPECIES: PPE family protein [unclassified Mycobacterium]MDP7706551.1 PPE family protein [Mycobacterium sp. TY815]MDP7725663.1 PPE family protein [Mycobacterium sp. TY814]